MPTTPCSFTYFPSGNFAAVHGSNATAEIVVKGGGGFIISRIGSGRPFIPIAALKLNAGTQLYEYIPLATQIAQMPDLIKNWFIAQLNASQNYYTDNVAGDDQFLIANDFASYLFKRVASNTDMLKRYQYLANEIALFWQNADPAWTNAQMVAAINNFKMQLIQGLADPNLYLSGGTLDLSAASVLSISIAAFKVADPDFQYTDNIEIYIP